MDLKKVQGCQSHMCIINPPKGMGTGLKEANEKIKDLQAIIDDNC